jgi:hypothetical protein
MCTQPKALPKGWTFKKAAGLPFSRVSRAPRTARPYSLEPQPPDQTIPSYCDNAYVPGFFYGEFALDVYHICQVWSVQAQLWEVSPSGLRPLGTADFLNTTVTTTQADHRVWMADLYVNMYQATDLLAAGTEIDTVPTWFSCSVSQHEFYEESVESATECNIEGEFPPPVGPVPVRVNQPMSGWIAYSANLSRDYVWAYPFWYLEVRHPSTPVEDLSYGGGMPVRCDTAPYFNYGEGGCIHSGFNRTLELSLSDPEVEQAAAFYRDAQEELPEHPGRPTPGWVSPLKPLTRLVDPAAMDDNRRVACRSGFVLNDPLDSCDEYPFAATREGAFFGPFRVAHVPLAQNTAAGNRLSAFFQAEHVIDADPFFVRITP